MGERIENDHGDDEGATFLTENAWTTEQQAELEQGLADVVRTWQAKHAIVLMPFKFTGTRNAERIEIPAPSSSPSPVPSSALPQVVSPSV